MSRSVDAEVEDEEDILVQIGVGDRVQTRLGFPIFNHGCFTYRIQEVSAASKREQVMQLQFSIPKIVELCDGDVCGRVG